MVDLQEQIKDLPEQFDGRGEVEGSKFKLFCKNNKGYVCEVHLPNGFIHWEVFKRKISSISDDFKKVIYPGSKSFGLWAWSFMSSDKAIQKFQSF